MSRVVPPSPVTPSGVYPRRRTERGGALGGFALVGFACALLVLLVGMHGWQVLTPVFSAGVLLFVLGVLAFIRTRRRRSFFRSGQAELVRLAALDEIADSAVPENFTALALVGVGDFSLARRALLADRSNAAPESREISLCARIVIESFEGQAESALSLCQEMLHDSAEQLSERREARRQAVIAIARLLSGTADEEDYIALTAGQILEPSLSWACRYSVALSCQARGEGGLARSLVAGAPTWEQRSFFSELHLRLSGRRAGSSEGGCAA